MGIKELIIGNKKFVEEKLPLIKEQVEYLVEHGQKPEVMFIGCSDSRVTPDLMLSTKPGDMFILRNVGNFVPPFKHDEDFHGSAAAIEYAIAVLKVKDIIVCGHSHCGACEALYNEIPNSDSFIHIKTWLQLGQKAKLRTLKNKKFTTKDEMYRATERNSIRHQLENLLTYPDVVRKLKEKTLNIHGWYYDIKTGEIEYYEKESDTFLSLKNFKI